MTSIQDRGASAIAMFSAASKLIDKDRPKVFYGDEVGWVNNLAWFEPVVKNSVKNPFPLDALPDIIREHVQEVVEITQCPIALAVNSALGALSGAAQGHFDVARDANTNIPISLWFMTVAESGERKSSADRFCFEPFKTWESIQHLEYSNQLQKYKLELEAYEIAKSAIKSSSKKQSPEEIMHQLRRLEVPEPPIEKIILWETFTTEALIKHLSGFPIAYGCVNEAGTLLGGYATKPENVQRTFATWNKLWDGQSVKDVTRGEGTRFVASPRFTFQLMLQESIYNSLLGIGNGMAQGIGLTSRFLVCQPESTMGMRFYSEPPNRINRINRFTKILTQFLDKSMNLEDGVLKPAVLKLSPEAKVEWIEFHNLVEQELGFEGDYQAIKSIAAKSAENLLRISANFQVAIEPNANEISAEVMRSAKEVANYYLNEALKMALPQAQIDAEKILNWLVRTIGIYPYEKKLVCKNSSIRKADRVNPAIDYLIEQGLVQTSTINQVEWMAINPYLLGGR